MSEALLQAFPYERGTAVGTTSLVGGRALRRGFVQEVVRFRVESMFRFSFGKYVQVCFCRGEHFQGFSFLSNDVWSMAC